MEQKDSGVPKDSTRNGKSKVDGNQGSSRCSSENSRDCGYSSEAINDNGSGSCSSPDYFEDQGKYYEQERNYKNTNKDPSLGNVVLTQNTNTRVMITRSPPSSFPIPYKSLEEQLEVCTVLTNFISVYNNFSVP